MMMKTTAGLRNSSGDIGGIDSGVQDPSVAGIRILSCEIHVLVKHVKQRDAPPGEKPEPMRTHLRNMIIVPEMIGSIVGVYNGKTFNQVEIKPEMIGHYLAEFSISYKPVKHGRPGIGATHSSRFIPLK
ncbi:hypothetical protein ZIOFF_039331 [Zingiber officinale]|uniref:40S ribosomal protein S15 n=1 Tax=Zingiber officinale TaxID=94328 RepID=A0A8J5L2X8_ZINOF|nr:hypothetical protein ZIOFF_039331 [Zingiber officinale]